MTPFIDITFELLIFFMLTIRWKEAEGRLLSHLPPDIGIPPMNSLVETPVRVVLCLDGDVAAHLTSKGAHDVPRDATGEAHIFVQRIPIGVARLTDGRPTAEADALYDAAIRAALRLRGDEPVEFDVDGEVAVQHVIGALNALQRAAPDAPHRFAAGPRLARYFRNR